MSVLRVVDHLAQQEQHRDPFGRVEIAHGQFADLRGARRGLGDQFGACRGQANQFLGLEALDDTANGRLIHGSGLDQFRQGACTVIAQCTQGDELHGGELRVADILLKDRQVALVGLAQQVANLFRKDVGIRHGGAR
ncbi:hypothetical protein Ddc_21240 [Ditylenchus destructor]|nr:hypothetical protein Ddc_21240 [Ditylenchus destructor]